MDRRRFLGIVAAGTAASVSGVAAAASRDVDSDSTDARRRALVLLGDSVFDNGSFVGEGEGVLDHLRSAASDIEGRLSASSLARSGARIADVKRKQLPKIEVTPDVELVALLSAGGNDLTRWSSELTEKCSTVGDAVLRFGGLADGFEKNFSDLVQELGRRVGLSVLATIPEPRPSSARARLALRTAVAISNDRILRVASERGLPVLDLRVILCDPDHFADGIHPSSVGGSRIATAALAFVRRHERGAPRCELIGSPDRK